MAKKIQQFYVVKLEANKILSNNLNLNLSLYEARKNQELVSVGDSQVLRVIRRYMGRDINFEDLDELIRQKQILKRKIKKYNEKEQKDQLFEVLRKIDYYLYIPEYVSVVSEKRSQYNSIAKRGFTMNGYLYKRFMCSAGNARNNTAFFIREDLLKPIGKILKNGHNKIKIAEAKYNAYFSLTSSATLIVSDPKVIVVPDLEVKRTESVDWVSKTNNGYDVERKDVELPFNLWDGMGLISPVQAKRWADELQLDYLPSGFLLRAPFIKGMVFVFDFHKFAYEVAGKTMIKDVWGNEHHVDDVEVIITQSQFKLWNAYDNWSHYERSLKENGLDWGVAKFTPDVDKDFIRTNYQFVQVLNLNDNDVEGFCKPTVNWFKGMMGADINYIKLYLLGKVVEKGSVKEIWKNIQDPFVKALMIDDRAKEDKYIQSKILQSLQKRIKESYIGKLLINGNFQMMINDPYALCEHLFDIEVKGLLKRDEYYSDYWNNKGVNIIAGMRSPLTWRSEVNKMPLVVNEEVKEWYKYLGSGIVYNVFGYDCLIHAGSDVDGDIVCTTDNKYFVNNMFGGVPVIGEHSSPTKHEIKERSLYKFDGKAFNTKIGYITNCSTTMYEMLQLYENDSIQKEELIKRLKLCCHFQALTIDSAKGIKADKMPSDWTKWTKITEEIENKDKAEFNNSLLIEKRPYFMRYLYPNYNTEYKNYIENYNNFAISKFGYPMSEIPDDVKSTDEYIDFIKKYNRFNPMLETNGVMNKVCRYMEKECKNIKIDFKSDVPDNFFKIYLNNNIQIDNDKLKLMVDKFQEYISFKKNKHLLDESVNFNMYCSNLRNDILNISLNICELANLAVYTCYVLYPKKPKDFAWDICGDGIVANMIENNGGLIEVEIPVPDENGYLEYLNKKYSSYREVIWQDDDI